MTGLLSESTWEAIGEVLGIIGLGIVVALVVVIAVRWMRWVWTQ